MYQTQKETGKTKDKEFLRETGARDLKYKKVICCTNRKKRFAKKDQKKIVWEELGIQMNSGIKMRNIL